MTDQASLLLRKQLKGKGRFSNYSRCEFLSTFYPVLFSPRNTLSSWKPVEGPRLLNACRRLTITFSFCPAAELTRNPVEGFSAGLADDV